MPTTPPPPADPANGYEAHAPEFITGRTASSVGASTVAAWARRLAPGSVVLDVGCGPGVPISRTLLEAGHVVYGVDASPRMVAAFRARLPGVPVVCAPAETSGLFGRSFDAAVAWGLLFLLPLPAQERVIHRVAGVLRPTGEFLFTAPYQTGEWDDNLTGLRSVSAGRATYLGWLEAAGLSLVEEYTDEGENHYYRTRRPPA